MTDGESLAKEFIANDIVQNRFTILNKIGKGSQGGVFKASDLKNKNRMVAVKQYIITPMMDEKSLQQIDSEAKVLQQVNHLNIMKCYQIYRETQQYILILEYIDGILLSKFIEKQFGKLNRIEKCIDANQVYNDILMLQSNLEFRYQYHSYIRKLLKNQIQKDQIQLSNFNMSKKLVEGYHPQSVKLDQYEDIKYFSVIHDLFQQLLDVLIILDKNQIIHRDLKPENIMITKSLEMKLIDFGFCKKSIGATTYAGTAAYMAPEVYLPSYDDRHYTNKIDIWSAGAIFYEMLFGYAPFLCTQSSLDNLQEKYGLYLPTDIFEPQEELSNYIQIIEQAFTIDPAKRPSARDLNQMFQEKTQTELKNVKVIFLGDNNVGKTSILKKMSHFAEQNVMQCISHKLKLDNQKICVNFYDTLGTENRNQSVMPNIIKGANICFLVYRQGNKNSFNNIKFWKQQADKLQLNIQYCILQNKQNQVQLPQDEKQPLMDTQIIQKHDSMDNEIPVDTDNTNFDEILTQQLKIFLENEKKNIVQPTSIKKKKSCC